MYLARILTRQRDGPDHNKQLEEGAVMYEVRGTYSTNVQIPRKFL